MYKVFCASGLFSRFVISLGRLDNQTVANGLGADCDPADFPVYDCPHFLRIRFKLPIRNPGDFFAHAAQILGLTSA